MRSYNARLPSFLPSFLSFFLSFFYSIFPRGQYIFTLSFCIHAAQLVTPGTSVAILGCFEAEDFADT